MSVGVCHFLCQPCIQVLPTPLLCRRADLLSRGGFTKVSGEKKQKNKKTHTHAHPHANKTKTPHSIVLFFFMNMCPCAQPLLHHCLTIHLTQLNDQCQKWFSDFHLETKINHYKALGLEPFTIVFILHGDVESMEILVRGTTLHQLGGYYNTGKETVLN